MCEFMSTSPLCGLLHSLFKMALHAHICLPECVNVCMSLGPPCTCGGQKRVLDRVELESEAYEATLLVTGRLKSSLCDCTAGALSRWAGAGYSSHAFTPASQAL